MTLETEILELSLLATSVMNVLDNKTDSREISRHVCIQILKNYYYTDRSKFDTVIKIIKERRKNDKRNRESSVSRANSK